MAIGTPVLIEAKTELTFDADIVLTVPAGGVPAGSQINIMYGTKQEAEAPSVSDTAGNSYTTEETDLNHAGDNLSATHFRSGNVTALAQNDTITISVTSNTNRKAAVGWYTTGLGALDTDSIFAEESTASPASANISTADANEIMFGLLCWIAGPNTRIVTEDGDFTIIGEAKFTASDNRLGVHAAYRILTATETNNYIPTLDLSARTFTGIVAYKESAVTGRIMSSLVGAGGLVGSGGLVGPGGGLVARRQPGLIGPPKFIMPTSVECRP